MSLVFEQEVQTGRTLKAYLFESRPKMHKELRIYLRGLDEINLKTNLFSVLAPQVFRAHQVHLEQDHDYLVIDIVALEDIIPMIGKKSKEGVKTWILNWDTFFKKLYGEIEQESKFFLDLWLNSPAQFIESVFPKELMAPESLIPYVQKVQKDLEHLVIMRSIYDQQNSYYYCSLKKLLEQVKNHYEKGLTHNAQQVKWVLMARDRSCLPAIRLFKDEFVRKLYLLNPTDHECKYLLQKDLSAVHIGFMVDSKLSLNNLSDFMIKNLSMLHATLSPIDSTLEFKSEYSKYVRKSNDQLFKTLKEHP